MNSLGILYWIVIFILMNAQQRKAIPPTDFEKTVFYEVFPTVIDSIYFESRLLPPPPPPPDYLEKMGFKVKNDSKAYQTVFENWKKSGKYKKRMNDWRKRKDSILKDTSSIYLVVPDSVFFYTKIDSIELKNYFKDKNLKIKDPDLSKNFHIEKAKLITHKEKIKFKYRSEFPERREFSRILVENDHIAASLGFSRILFDQTKTYGVLNAAYVMGRLNGYGVRIFIEKNKEGNWEVKEVVGTWIS